MDDGTQGATSPSESHLLELRERVSDRVFGILERSAVLGFLGGMGLVEQIDHALGFVDAAERAFGRPPDSVLDLGTGGGVPGLVLAGCWPGCRVVLMDVNERRTEFLTLELEDWSPAGAVSVLRGRAEELGRDGAWRERFELVTSRSFGPPAVTAECGGCFVAVDGYLVVSEPPDSDPLERWPDEGLAHLGLQRSGQYRFDGRFGFQVLAKIAALGDRYPRRVGIPAKRPLF